MKIAIGADHRGFAHKQYIQKIVRAIDNEPCVWIDVGTHNTIRSDYPVFTKKVCECMLAHQAQYGVLLCATGIGMSIAANRYRGMYAALVWNEQVARLSRQHDNANIIVLPSDFVDQDQAVALISAWLTTQPLGGRYQERTAMIDEE